MYFSRFANTYDDFDTVITKKTNFCFTVGVNQNCFEIEGKLLFPQMNVESAIKLYGNKLTALFGLLILILLSFWVKNLSKIQFFRIFSKLKQ